MPRGRYIDVSPSPQNLRALWDQIHTLRNDHDTSAATIAAQANTIAALQANLATTSQQAKEALLTAGQAVTSVSAVGATTSTGSGSVFPPPSTAPFTDTRQGNLGCTEAGADGHVAPGSALTVETAGQIICGTGNEYPALKAIAVDQPTRDANRDELLDRMVWHLNLAGFPAMRYGTVAGRPWILLFNIPGGIEVAYRVASYETFETPFTTVMVFGGSSLEIVTPDAGIAD